MVIFLDRENNGQSVTRSTIMSKLSQILAIRMFFLYSSVSEFAFVTIVYFSLDRAPKDLVTENIFKSRK